jgi:hypothetical protein
MKQKYINSVAFKVDDELDQIFPYHTVPEDIKLEFVMKNIESLMADFEVLMNKQEQESE